MSIKTIIGLFMFLASSLNIQAGTSDYQFLHQLTSSEVTQIIPGNFYRPTYLYHTPTNSFLISVYDNEKDLKIFSKVDGNGLIINRLDLKEDYEFSLNGLILIGLDGYYDWFGTGAKNKSAYHKIINRDLKLSDKEWSETFQELYKQASIVDYRSFKTFRAAVFKIENNWSILFAAENYSSIWYEDIENKMTALPFGGFVKQTMSYRGFPKRATHGFELMLPQIEDESNFRKSTLNNISLELTNFEKTYSQKAGPPEIPKFLNHESIGTGYFQLSLSNSNIKFKVSKVKSYQWAKGYGAGLQIYHPPHSALSKTSIAFLEASESWNADREGLGIYILRKSTNNLKALKN